MPKPGGFPNWLMGGTFHPSEPKKNPSLLSRAYGVETEVTLRDFFAAQVMSPMLMQAYGNTPHILAKHAYEIADAMLLERAREET